MRFFSWREMAARRGTSVSTEKRLFEEDPDYPDKVAVSVARVGFPEDQAERYDQILIARQADADGKPSGLNKLVRQQAAAKANHARAALYTPDQPQSESPKS